MRKYSVIDKNTVKSIILTTISVFFNIIYILLLFITFSLSYDHFCSIISILSIKNGILIVLNESSK